MKTINYAQLLAEHKPMGYVSGGANIIANTLICENGIQAGNGVARLLDVDCCFDNHMAVRVWVQRRLDAQDGYVVNEMYHQLQVELYELFSMLGYGL